MKHGLQLIHHVRAVSRAPLWPVAVILGLIGAFALILGAPDTFGAADPESRVLGAVLATTGGLSLVGAGCIIAPTLRKTWARPLGLVGAGAGICVGLLLVAQAGGYGRPALTAAWALIAVASALAGWRVLMLPSHSAGARQQQRRRVTIASAVGAAVPLIGLGLSLVQFGYNTAYVPANAGAAMAINGSLSRSVAESTMSAYTIGLKLKNVGSTRVQVVASLFSVSRSTVAAIDLQDANDRTLFQRFDSGLRSGEQPTGNTSRYTIEGNDEIVQLGHVVPDGWYFEPGEEYDTQLSVEVPTAPRNLLRLFVSMVVARGIRLALADQPDYGPNLLHDGSYSYVVSDWPIVRLSNVRALTVGDQAATVLYVLQGSTSAAALPFELPEVFVCVDRADRVDDQLAAHVDRLCPQNDAFQRRMRDYYGLASTSTSIELPLAAGPDAGSGTR